MSTLQKWPELQKWQSLQEKIRNNPVATKAATLFTALSMLMASPALESCSKDSKETPDVISPTITIINNKNEIDITWWKTFSRSQNKLFMDNEEIANRKDNITTNCKADIKYTNSDLSETKEINGNVFIINPWTITITIEDDAWNITSKKINLTSQNPEEELITWLENLYKLNITVDEPVNLLEWVNIKNGLKPKVSIEIDWVTTQVNNPYSYTFNLPCTFNMIITLDKDYIIPNLSVKPIEYIEPTIITADILKDFPFYSVLKNQKERLHKFVLISMYGSSNCKQPISIMFWEAVEWSNMSENTTTTPHGREWAKRIKDISPNANLYWFYDKRINLETKLDPNKSYVISSAFNIIRNDLTKEEFDKDPNVKAIKNILNLPNVVIIASSGDTFWNPWDLDYWMVLNENITKDENYSVRNTSSVNSTNHHNKITVITEDTEHPENNYFSQTWWIWALRPIWYKLEEWNIVMFSTWWVSISNKEDPTTDTSYPTAILSWIISTCTSILMENYPWTTISNTMDIMAQNFYNKTKLKDKKDGNIIESNDYWYRINADKFINNEILHIPEIENTQFNSDMVELPSHPWLCYVGKWINFTFNWTLYEASKENQSYYDEALKRKDTKWIFNVTQFRKEWWWDFTDFSVFAVDRDWEMIPEIEHKCNYIISVPKYQNSYNIFGTWNNFYNTSSTWNNFYNPINNTSTTRKNFYNINGNQPKLKP